MRYWPVPSVTTDRTFSISTGLAASTVTPGRIAPDASLTTPVMAACAQTEAGRRTKVTTPTTRARTELRMRPPDADGRGLTTCQVGFYACVIGKATGKTTYNAEHAEHAEKIQLIVFSACSACSA